MIFQIFLFTFYIYMVIKFPFLSCMTAETVQGDEFMKWPIVNSETHRIENILTLATLQKK